MIIVATACRLTVCRPRGNPMFWRVIVLFTIYIYTAMAMPLVIRRDIAINSLFAFVFGFFAYKKFARPNWDANAWEKGMTVDMNSLINLLRRSTKNAACRLWTATYRSQDNYNIYWLCFFQFFSFILLWTFKVWSVFRVFPYPGPHP